MTRSEVLKWLERKGTRRHEDGLGRYGIVAAKAFGVPVGTLLKFAKQSGKDHALAAELWKSGWYEARMLAAMIDDPKQVTRRQMNAWVKDFANWGICDTVCWHLFDYTPHAWQALGKWSASPHIGGRSVTLHAAALALAKRLAASDQPWCRWVGKDALRDLSRPLVRARLARWAG
jgi:3-methyladenine DNA glycosylase AlkD